MKLHLNNKGYMLVEIILASVIAMGIAYFITDLTIKLKNKNDDLLVKTLVSTDQAIIYNTVMKDLYNATSIVDCNYIENRFLIKNGNVFENTNTGFSNIVSEYARLGSLTCNLEDDILMVDIPITVKQLPDEDFSVNIKYKPN